MLANNLSMAKSNIADQESSVINTNWCTRMHGIASIRGTIDHMDAHGSWRVQISKDIPLLNLIVEVGTIKNKTKVESGVPNVACILNKLISMSVQ